jgi:hypothetical protein
MRRKLWLAGLVLGLCGARPAWAQSANTWGSPVGPIQNQTIDTGANAIPALGTSAGASNPFHALANLFPHSGDSDHRWPFWMGRKKRRMRKIRAIQHLTIR